MAMPTVGEVWVLTKMHQSENGWPPHTRPCEVGGCAVPRVVREEIDSEYYVVYAGDLCVSGTWRRATPEEEAAWRLGAK